MMKGNRETEVPRLGANERQPVKVSTVSSREKPEAAELKCYESHECKWIEKLSECRRLFQEHYLGRESEKRTPALTHTHMQKAVSHLAAGFAWQGRNYLFLQEPLSRSHIPSKV